MVDSISDVQKQICIFCQFNKIILPFDAHSMAGINTHQLSTPNVILFNIYMLRPVEKSAEYKCSVSIVLSILHRIEEQNNKIHCIVAHKSKKWIVSDHIMD